MSNKVYISEHVKDSLLSSGLSDDQTQKAVQLIDSLGEGNIDENSHIVLKDDSSAGGLRAISADDVRVFFRYDPQQETVIVADVLPLVKKETKRPEAATASAS